MAINIFRVTAAVIEKDGKILIAKRRIGDRHGGRWEFPGGKIDAGETPEECLKRELKEELGIEAEIGELICSSTFKYMFVPLELLVYKVRHISGKFRALDHDELKWVEPSELAKYNFVKADVKVVKKLMRDIYHV
ncbi:MAG: 8-oxo-dGTP diphosphatase MutT [Candidatus Omnitrophica bacterium]|nr:8-oxo-dGTP diphosphatase MutT [Candidatus Omnitrophota bacterium]MBU0895672.1 8-oxo-dGTP diphosphatase MutT [Candidatus Omnitrophota bacterium]MBU1808885.1 8-oxo-dGTP diphosphatase MutT [Candidatus Omnitrophota bacterium]